MDSDSKSLLYWLVGGCVDTAGAGGNVSGIGGIGGVCCTTYGCMAGGEMPASLLLRRVSLSLRLIVGLLGRAW
jgi:hypothetical protein